MACALGCHKAQKCRHCCRRRERKRWGSGGLLPGQFFRATPSRTPESALLVHGFKVLSSLISVPRRKSDPLTSNEMQKNPRWPFHLLSYTCSPMLETKSRTNAPKERCALHLHWNSFVAMLIDLIITLQSDSIALQIQQFYLLKECHTPSRIFAPEEVWKVTTLEKWFTVMTRADRFWHRFPKFLT